LASELLNNVAWLVATDPLAPREDAQRLLQFIQAARYGLSNDWTHRDTVAAVLARAGEPEKACAEQRRVITLARGAKADAATLARLEQRRAAFCSGKTWDLLD
jgi:protein-disulfide isomerase-like protein with CxxC motif